MKRSRVPRVPSTQRGMFRLASGIQLSSSLPLVWATQVRSSSFFKIIREDLRDQAKGQLLSLCSITRPIPGAILYETDARMRRSSWLCNEAPPSGCHRRLAKEQFRALFWALWHLEALADACSKQCMQQAYAGATERPERMAPCCSRTFKVWAAASCKDGRSEHRAPGSSRSCFCTRSFVASSSSLAGATHLVVRVYSQPLQESLCSEAHPATS